MKAKRTQNGNHKLRKGITLLEVVISSLLISLLTIGALKTTGGALRTWYQVSSQYDETILAGQLLEEILQTSYEDPDETPEFGRESHETQSPSNRLEFDDTDDYDNWSESPPKTKDGTALAGFTGWIRSVDIKKLSDSSPEGNIADGATDQGLKRITVTVTDPNGNVTSISGWRSFVGGPDISKGADGTFVVWMGCELQVSAAGETASSGTSILNHATDQTP